MPRLQPLEQIPPQFLFWDAERQVAFAVVEDEGGGAEFGQVGADALEEPESGFRGGEGEGVGAVEDVGGFGKELSVGQEEGGVEVFGRGEVFGKLDATVVVEGVDGVGLEEHLQDFGPDWGWEV